MSNSIVTPNPANYIQQSPFSPNPFPEHPRGQHFPQPHPVNLPNYHNQPNGHQDSFENHGMHSHNPNSSMMQGSGYNNNNPDYATGFSHNAQNQPSPHFGNGHNHSHRSNHSANQSVETSSSPNIPLRAIYVSGLSLEATCEDICNVVRGGALERVKIMSHDPSKGHRPFTAAFLTFLEHEGAAAFMQHFDKALSGPMGGLWVRGVRLRCSWANPSAAGHRISGTVINALRKGASRTVFICRRLPHDQHNLTTREPKKAKYTSEPESNPRHLEDLPNEMMLDSDYDFAQEANEARGHSAGAKPEEATELPQLGGGKAALRKIFSVYGEIESVVMLPNGTIAFVNYCNILDAVKAIENQAIILPQLAGPHGDTILPLKYGRDRCARPSLPFKTHSASDKTTGKIYSDAPIA